MVESSIVKLDTSKLKMPISTWDELYTQIGCLDYTAQYKEKFNEVMRISGHVLVNDSEYGRLKDLIKNTWIYYNVDRRTGKYKRGKPHKYARKVGLSSFDSNTLSFHHLSMSPSILDEVPDGELWVYMEKDSIFLKKDL